jgi:hypothetical protein
MTPQLRHGIALLFAGNTDNSMRRIRRGSHSAAISAIQAVHNCIAIVLICCMIPLGVGYIYAQEIPPPQPEYF